MKTAFRRSFERDLKKLQRNRQMLARVREAIEEVEGAVELGEITSMKKLSGGSGDYYRIRIGDYRIGL
ncbi:type II toxin-antitoxin system RelE family toxin [Bythopirellula goksoeyrii]|uniref:type II toxin-antitoxin system RelE family toxin n=1 Tax=Bythopirellula goksoeyrii TaxID=1400387 RepID=UPI001AEFAAA1|nr:type II toxin-antitoxin system RelE/ParE family toxin [Bythopirellula goksoeyrii]